MKGSWLVYSCSAICLSLIILTSNKALGAANPLDEWKVLSPIPTRGTLTGVAYGAGTFVAVGRGSIVMSCDGVSWTATAGPYPASFNSICYADGKFVAVGDQGDYTETGWVGVSTNGVDWTAQSVPGARALLAVTFGNGQFVAMGRHGTALVSPDGIDWTLCSVKEGNWDFDGYGIAFGNGQFLGVGGARNVEVMTSADGISWVPLTNEDLMTTMHAIVFSGTTWVIVGLDYGGNSILTSPDAGTWTRHFMSPHQDLNSVIYAGGKYVAVGYAGAIVTSVDGADWSVLVPQTADSLYAVAFGNGSYVAVGARGAILSSVDGEHWVNRGALATEGLTGVASGQGLDLVAGDRAAILVNNVGWRRSETMKPTNTLGVAFAGGRFFANLAGGGLLTSVDARSWSSCAVEDPVTMLCVAEAQGQYIAVGDRIWTSTNGETWKVTYSPGMRLTGAAYGANAWVAVGSGGYVFRTTDAGVSWEFPSSGVTNSLKGVAFGNNRFVAVGAKGMILHSTDGKSWTSAPPLDEINLNAIVFGDTNFLAVGDSATIISSSDGLKWTRRSTDPRMEHLRSVSFGNGHFIAVGDFGTIAQSGQLALLPVRIDFHRSIDNAAAQLSVSGPTPGNYGIEFATQPFSDASWLRLTNVWLTNSPVTLPVETPQAGSGFYRVVLTQ